jgi:hypothetical protein
MLLFGVYKLYKSRNEVDNINKLADDRKKMYDAAIEIDSKEGSGTLSYLLDAIKQTRLTIYDLTKEEIATLSETCNLLDKDGDGRVTSSDLDRATNDNKNYTDAELQCMIAVVDTENKGSFECSEFMKFMFSQAKNSSST